MQLSTLLFAATAAHALPEVLSPRAATITVDPTTHYQPIDGFGFSEAFQRANLIVNMPSPKKEALLDLLFNRTTGAGFSIFRIGIGSSPDSSSDHMNSIEPKNPGGPSATPNYVWDGKDSGQLYVAQQAVKYGVSTFYADAWSAPGYMKSNGNENNGGYLCGVSGQSCSGNDWRQAFANYLIQWMNYYKAGGVNITHLGFLNEPEFSASYASMQSSGTQAADFIKILKPALTANANFSSVEIACCDSEGWSNQQTMTSQLRSAGVEPMIGIITSHTYASGFNGPIKTSAKVWQTEYSDLNGGWTTNWYSSGSAGEGMTWANTMHTALTSANCSGYLYWVATQNGNTNESMIKANSTGYDVSKRVWAMAAWARYVRPGATRIGVTDSSGMKTTAFVNGDGTVVVVCLNTGTSAQTIALSVKGGAFAGATVGAWITDQTHAMDSTTATIAADGSVSGSVPSRSVVTFLLTPAAAPAPSAVA